MNLNPLHALGNVLKFDWHHGGSLFAEGSKDILGFGWHHGGAGAAKGALGSALGHLSLAQLWALLLAVVAAIWQILLGYFPQLDHAVKGLVHPSAFSVSCAATSVPVGGIAGVGYRFGSLAHTAINPPDFNPAAMQTKLEAAGRQLGAGIAEGWGAFEKALHGAPTPTAVLPPAAQVSVPSCCPAAPTAPTTPAGLTGAADVTAARAVLAAGFPDPLTALEVAGAESGYNPLAVNPTSSASGLFQIMLSIHGAKFGSADWRDPYANARVAKMIYDNAHGWTPWQAHTNGSYLQWQTRAQTALAKAQGQAGPFLAVSTPTVPLSTCTPPITAAGYVNPLPDPRWQPARTDQGVDYAPQVPLPVLALGDGVVTYSSIHSGWPGGGFLTYRLTSGSHAGLYVFVAEHLTNLLPVGTVVHPGQAVAVGHPGYPWIETGWAAPTGDSPAVPYNGLPDGTPTAGGLAFARFLRELGRTTLQDPGPGPDRPDVSLTAAG